MAAVNSILSFPVMVSLLWWSGCGCMMSWMRLVSLELMSICVCWKERRGPGMQGTVCKQTCMYTQNNKEV